MADLKTVWFGMLTDDSDDSGTDSPIVLIINVRGGRFDVLRRTFPTRGKMIRNRDKRISTK